MNYREIVEQEGYRLEDLTPEHQTYISGMKQLLSDFQLYYAYETDDEDSIIDQLKQQIANEVIEDIYSWLELQLLEYQIGAGDAEAVERYDNARRA